MEIIYTILGLLMALATVAFPALLVLRLMGVKRISRTLVFVLGFIFLLNMVIQHGVQDTRKESTQSNEQKVRDAFFASCESSESEVIDVNATCGCVYADVKKLAGAEGVTGWFGSGTDSTKIEQVKQVKQNCAQQHKL